MKFKESVTYDDLLLVPQYSEIMSRKEVNISSTLKNGPRLSLPIIASPMDTISEGAMCLAMAEAGGLAVIHRYNTIAEQVAIVDDIYRTLPLTHTTAAAIGVTGDYQERASALVDAGVTILCVDVAHGHHILMKDALLHLRAAFGRDIHIMAGNVCTLEGVNDLADWGADSVRCNIGGGSICSTRIQTGHGLPGLQTVFDCAQTDRDVSIIADGGIKTSGDIVKALAAGADFVMCGSLLSGTAETPGDLIVTSRGPVKTYRGMASKDAQLDWRSQSGSPEGISTTVPYRREVAPILEDLRGGIASGLSYSGARSLSSLRSKSVWVRQTFAGTAESTTHILSQNK